MYLALLSFCLTSGYLLWAMYLVQEMYKITNTDGYKKRKKRGFINQITLIFALNALGHAIYMFLI